MNFGDTLWKRAGDAPLGTKGATAVVWAEVSAASFQEATATPRRRCGDSVETGRLQAQRAVRKGYFKSKSGGERS